MLNKEQISTDNHALNSVRLCYGRGDLLSDHNVGILKYNFCLGLGTIQLSVFHPLL